jgi:uncharacterized membrane protein
VSSLYWYCTFDVCVASSIARNALAAATALAVASEVVPPPAPAVPPVADVPPAPPVDDVLPVDDVPPVDDAPPADVVPPAPAEVSEDELDDEHAPAARQKTKAERRGIRWSMEVGSAGPVPAPREWFSA